MSAEYASIFPLAVIDVETTGIDHQTESLTEVAAVRMEADGSETSYVSFVKTNKPISPFITKLTGISTADVSTAPPPEVVVKELITFVEGCTLAAHNAAFDLAFLRHASHQAGLDFPRRPVLDTLTLSRLTFPRDLVGNHRLATMAEYLGIDPGQSHRALADATAAARVLTKLLRTSGLKPVDGWHSTHIAARQQRSA